jgi:hypothetical protein
MARKAYANLPILASPSEIVVRAYLPSKKANKYYALNVAEAANEVERCDLAKSGRTKFARQLGCGKVSSLRRKRSGLDWILHYGGSSLTQPEQEKNSCEPEEKPS